MKQGKAIITSRNSHGAPTTRTEPLELVKNSFLTLFNPREAQASQDIWDKPATLIP